MTGQVVGRRLGHHAAVKLAAAGVRSPCGPRQARRTAARREPAAPPRLPNLRVATRRLPAEPRPFVLAVHSPTGRAAPRSNLFAGASRRAETHRAGR
jgi:hypothetical protein